MAYFALSNLRNTIDRLENFSRLPELLYSFGELFDDYRAEEIVTYINYLENVIEELDGRSRNKRVKAFFDKILEAAHALEDVVESVLSRLIRIAQSDLSIGNQRPSTFRKKVRKGLKSFVQTVKEIEEYRNELKCSLSVEDEKEDEEEEENECSRFYFCEKKPKMVGSYTQELITEIKDQLNEGYKSSEFRVFSIVGVAGSGRSTYARDIFHGRFHGFRDKPQAWVRVGPKYEFKDILVNILSQIDSSNDHKFLDSEGEEKIFEYVHTILKGGDYLIVLDDVREIRLWEYLRKLFPDENNGGRVLLTTHLEEVAEFAQSFSIRLSPLLHNEKSWNIISQVLFANEERCPPQLEKVGRKIAENCKGLRFEVAKYTEILSKVDRTPEHWNNVEAEMVDFAVDVDAYDEISEILKMRGDANSVHFLPPIMSKALGLPNSNYRPWKDICIFSMDVAVTGMAGIGKTALARTIFDDPWTLRSYEHRVWLTLGPKYQLKGILADILAELDPNIDKMHTEADETLVKHINSILSSKRCFIVLDDVWDENPWSALRKLLYGIKCEVLLTTRLLAVARKYVDRVHAMQLLNEEESWSLLRERVFGEELCPRELEKPGKLIAENCEGLPLMIVMVATLLSKDDDKTPEYWYEVAMNKNSVLEVAYRKISKILYPSYKNLELERRACFLYMAAFPVTCKIPLRLLLPLHNAEGIIQSGSWTRYDIHNYFQHLYGRSLAIYNVYKCSIHSVFWHLCVREARNDKFFHVMRTKADCSSEDIEKQRRLCVQNSVLFAIKDVYDSMASVSAARSLLCTSLPHPYQVPICLDSKFLKVLYALSIRLYEFPVEISTLVLLRYLAITYNGALPSSISKLWNLECLIINEYMSIRFPGDLSYVPVEIWGTKELKHLQIIGRNLPDPPNNSSTILDGLTTLIGVSAESLTKRILERIPNLEDLLIHIELAPDHASEPLFSFDHISNLQGLKLLECYIINPELKYVPAPFSMLPSGLRELTLSGCGYPWELLRPIALLPNLKELLLKFYAFQGAEWVMQKGYFPSLHKLVLEDTDLVKWRADDSSYLVSLRTLTISWCFKLKEIPWKSIPRTCNTTLFDCNPLASKKIPEHTNCQVIFSWIEH